jgi:hypothetical protein
MKENDPCDRLDDWLSEDPEINAAILSRGSTGANYQVRLMQAGEVDDEHPCGEHCVADAESATLEGAIEGALLLAREFREGHT